MDEIRKKVCLIVKVVLWVESVPHATKPDDTAGTRDLVSRLLQLPCGLVRGALSNLGLVAVVRASFLDDRGGMSDLPAVSFTIKIRSGGQQQ